MSVYHHSITERDRKLWGDEWADQAEMCLREESVRLDTALSIELGKRALLYLAAEYAIPGMTVWDHVCGRTVLPEQAEELAMVA